MQRMLQPVERRTRRVTADRHQHGCHHAGDRRMNPRLQHEQPQRGPCQQIGPQRHHLPPVEDVEHQQRKPRAGQRQDADRIGIGDGDDRHRAHVVNDRDGGQQQLERRRHARSEQRQHADREGDVGRGGDRPAGLQSRRIARDEQEDERRHRHPRDRGDERQPPPVGAGQPATDELPLDLQPDEQEEQRHQPVVDPQVDGHWPQSGRERRADLCVQQRLIAVRRRRPVGGDHRQRGRGDQHDPTRRLSVQKGAQRVAAMGGGLGHPV